MTRVASEFHVTPFTVPVEPREGVSGVRPRGEFGNGGQRFEIGNPPSAKDVLQANPGSDT
jgi:hypothetical protein